MTAMRTKRDLFGGTLRCAGLATAAVITSNAMAEFFPDAPFDALLSGESIVYGENVNGTSFGNYAYSSGASFTDTLSYSYAGWAASAYAGSIVIGASVTEFDPVLWNSGYATIFQWVSVQDSKKVVVEWDLGGGAHGGVRVYQNYVGDLIDLSIDPLGGDATGSESFIFEPGELYLLVASVSATEEFSGTGFVRFTSIPAPGALGILGIGILSVKRRRRT